MKVPAYRLDELGWLQFERLCELVLGADGLAAGADWLGHADSARVGLADGLTVVLAWAPVTSRHGDSLARAAELAERLEALPDQLGFMFTDRVLLVTNLYGAAVGPHRLDHLGWREMTVLGAAELSELVDRHPVVRAAMPSVLGLRDLAALVPERLRGSSMFDAERAQMLARVFWPTRAYERARALLARHRFAVLTGPPEMGKTAIAQMLGLGHLCDGWEVHETGSPDQVWRVFDPGVRQLFIADDAFGSTEYRADAAERWAAALGRLLALLDERHMLIWTSRPAPLKAGLRRIQRERGASRFPAPGEVLVDASDLDLAEKTLILFRHAKARRVRGTARAVLSMSALAVVEHPHFTPERIRRFVADLEVLITVAGDEGVAALKLALERELACPTDAMRTSFHALTGEQRDFLIALLDAPSGLIDERELAAVVRRHHAGGLSRPPHELIDRLTDHFLRATPLGIGWVHPSWRDLVIEELQADTLARRRFLGAAGVHGIALALSREGGAAGERALPLLSDDADWDQLAARILELALELDNHELARVMQALTGVLEEPLTVAAMAEAEAIAVSLLNATARRWDSTRAVLDAFVLDAWFALDDWVPDETDVPSLTWTWAAVHPGSPPGDRGFDRAELAALDEWLALAQTLSVHHPDGLVWLGFFEADQELVGKIVRALRRTTGSGESAQVEAVLERIGQVSPRHWVAAEMALAACRQAAEDAPDWWVPEDLPAPPSFEPEIRGPVEFTRDDVARVLADL